MYEIYKGYYINKKGEVISNKYKEQKKLKPWLGTNGYLNVSMMINGKKYNKAIHRLVAEAFIENKNKLKQVNHKNGNKLDNRIENLEWVTHSENATHSYKNNLNSKQRKVKCIKTNEVFKSLSECSEFFKISRQVVCDHCKGRVKNARFQYVM